MVLIKGVRFFLHHHCSAHPVAVRGLPRWHAAPHLNLPEAAAVKDGVLFREVIADQRGNYRGEDDMARLENTSSNFQFSAGTSG